jgi:5'-nucleotidase
LIETASSFGELLIVAPDKPQSGMGHAITVNNIIRVDESELFTEYNAFSCTGTPVDCIKVARHFLGDRKPDLVVSGINHGANTGISVLYSGTMSAAVEGAIEGIPSVGFSLDSFEPKADFEGAKVIVKQVIKKMLELSSKGNGVCLNVNIPAVPKEVLKGLKVCRAAKAMWKDELHERIDQHGRKYYWLSGEFANDDLGKDTDLAANAEGYASVVPIHFDMTAYHLMSEINNWNL